MVAKVIQLRPKTLEKQERVSNTEAYSRLRMFELLDMRKDLTKMAKRLKVIEGKLRMRLITNAKASDET